MSLILHSMIEVMMETMSQLRVVIKIFCTNYGTAGGFRRFLDDIHQVKGFFTPQLEIAVGLWSTRRITQAVPYLSILMMTPIYLYFTLQSEPKDLHWNLLLGDLGLSFGSFRRVFDICCLSSLISSMSGLTCVVYIHEKSGHTVWVKCWSAWITWLYDQNLDLISHLGCREKILVWKFIFSVKLLTNSVSFLIPGSVFGFMLRSRLDLKMKPLYVAASIFWILIDPLVAFVITGFFSWLVCIVSSQMLYYAVSMRSVTRHFRLNIQPLVVLKAWSHLEQEFGRNAPIHNLLMLSSIPFMLICSLLWFYAANHFSINLVLKLLTYTSAAAVLSGSVVFIVAAATVSCEQRRFPSALYRLVYSEDQRYDSLHDIRAVKNLLIRKLVLRWIKHETVRSTFVVRFGQITKITAYSAFLVSTSNDQVD